MSPASTETLQCDEEEASGVADVRWTSPRCQTTVSSGSERRRQTVYGGDGSGDEGTRLGVWPGETVLSWTGPPTGRATIKVGFSLFPSVFNL